jgi:hypothetical protein
MPNDDFPTDPNAETIGLPSDDGGKGSVPELGKHATTGMPSEIGRYKILGIIASGGMGVVYEAMQEAPRRRVALKVIKAGAASEMALHRFDFEAQILAKLRHPNIAQIYEAGTWESEQGPAPFFAMEYIPGRKGLIDYADANDLSMKERLELFSKICDAVHHGHQKAVIHRDLKPDNILVDSSGEPKIIDFGVARATDADLTVTTMQTTMGQLIGTLQYMSPEQCEADPDLIDTRSDVYALGVILFQLLSGKLPYDLRRQAIHEAVRVIKEQRPDSMSTLNMTLRGDVDTITMKALEKERDRRYQSAAELAGDIHHFLNNEPIIARPLSMTYQISLFTKKYKRTCAAVVLLAISIVLGLIGTGYGMQQARVGWAAAAAQLERVEKRNVALGEGANRLSKLITEDVRKFPNAAEIQREMADISLLGLIAQNEGQDGSSSRLELVLNLILYAKSTMSFSSAGFGDLNKAAETLSEAKEILQTIDVNAIHDPDPTKQEELIRQFHMQKLGLGKISLELILSRANQASDDIVQRSLLQQAVDICKSNEEAGQAYYESSGDWKGLKFKQYATNELGNQLLALDDREGSRKARTEALALIEEIAHNDPSPRTDRTIAIAIYNLAEISSPQEAMNLLGRAVPLIRSVVEAQPDYSRRKRDLAYMLALRGSVQIENNLNVKAGLVDIEESALLFTKRAINNPQEGKAQGDFENTMMQFSQLLTNAGKSDLVTKICVDSINQLEHVASGESTAGRDDWIKILSRLRTQIEQPKTAAVPQ